MPCFNVLSKSQRTKILQNSSIITLPKGWHCKGYHSNFFHLIINGSFHIKSGRALAESKPTPAKDGSPERPADTAKKITMPQIASKQDCTGILKRYIRNNN